MTKKKKYQWFLSDTDKSVITVIELRHPDFFVRVTEDMDYHPIVGVYDLLTRVGYLIQFNNDPGVGRYEGVEKPLQVNEEGFQVGNPDTFKWMTLESKEHMIQFMKRAISYRVNNPLPAEYLVLWNHAIAVVKFLNIIKGGQKRY